MYQDEIRALLSLDVVQRAFRFIEASDEATIRDQVELTEIPAPPFGEAARAAEFLRRVEALGIDDAWIDEAGNVLGLRWGQDRGRPVAISGHLDTVFPEGTDVRVRIRGDTLSAPGICDDGRGLAVVLALLRAMNEVGLTTRADLLFVGTVGEEGLGDLRGVKHLFREGGPPIGAFISVDGSDRARITHGAVGSRRYRATIRGPGGHAWGAFGTGNPALALARAAVHLDRAGGRLARGGPRTSYNVGRIGGGTSVNAIPSAAWMEVDLRSEDPEALQALDEALHEAVHQGVAETNLDVPDGARVKADVELIGSRPSGEIPPDTPFVRRAVAATRALGAEPVLTRASTDASVPISLGIPALTVGGGGFSGRSHALDEWFVNEDGPMGIQRVLLIVAAQAGIAGDGSRRSTGGDQGVRGSMR